MPGAERVELKVAGRGVSGTVKLPVRERDRGQIEFLFQPACVDRDGKTTYFAPVAGTLREGGEGAGLPFVPPGIGGPPGGVGSAARVRGSAGFGIAAAAGWRRSAEDSRSAKDPDPEAAGGPGRLGAGAAPGGDLVEVSARRVVVPAVAELARVPDAAGQRRECDGGAARALAAGSGAASARRAAGRRRTGPTGR